MRKLGQNASDITVIVGVFLPEVGGDRINDDQRHAANGIHLRLKPRQVPVQIEQALPSFIGHAPRMNTLSRSAPAAMSLGTIVSAASSSAEMMMTFPGLARPVDAGHCPPFETVAAILMATCDFATPGSPASVETLPTARTAPEPVDGLRLDIRCLDESEGVTAT